MKILDLQQGTLEWHEARRCKITGTKLSDVMGTSWAQLQLICELIAEEGTEQTKAFRVTPEMERGTSEEVFALKAYKDLNPDKDIHQVGFCISDEFDFLGVSPDALILDKDGKYSEALEIKNPDSKTTIFYRLANILDSKELGLTATTTPFLGIPANYKWQTVTYFLVNPDLKKLHFLVYDARFISDNCKMLVTTINVENEVLQDALKQAREKLKEFQVKWLRYRDLALPDNF